MVFLSVTLWLQALIWIHVFLFSALLSSRLYVHLLLLLCICVDVSQWLLLLRQIQVSASSLENYPRRDRTMSQLLWHLGFEYLFVVVRTHRTQTAFAPGHLLAFDQVFLHQILLVLL